MLCKYCGSGHIRKNGKHKEFQRYKCMCCGKCFDGEVYEENFIYHFNVKIKKTDRNMLTRENYCIPTNELDYKEKKNIRIALEAYARGNGVPGLIPRHYYDIPNTIFADLEHYTDEYVEEHYEECMENFDLNMKFFSKIDFNAFNTYLARFTKKNKFIQIHDLNEVKDMQGIYILVLDKYKQVYIGKAEGTGGIKQRILSHWSSRKPFNRLMHGTVETSILSIDSFGALDTTRIFYRELKWYQNIHEYEEKYVSTFKPDYRLNRVAGGLNAEEFTPLRNLQLINSTQKRQLK